MVKQKSEVKSINTKVTCYNQLNHLPVIHVKFGCASIGADLMCSTLGAGGGEQMICVLAWGCLPLCAGGRCGRGPRGYYHRENLDISHKKSCIFVHICMVLVIQTVMAAGNNRYSHFNAKKHEKIRRNVGGHLLSCPPTKLLGGHVPVPPVSASMCKEVHSRSDVANLAEG